MAATHPIPSSLASAYAACRVICRRDARSFYFASHFLPQPKRDHAYAIYAFCRLLDDAADEDGRAEALDAFEQTLGNVYRGTDLRHGMNHVVDETHVPEDRATDVVVLAFAHTVHTCQIPQQHFLDLVAGCRMDLASCVRFQTWQELERYCYLVAGVVGRIMCCVFEVRSDRAEAHAVAMGNAMQLTNILRDVREDLDRGRLYLPREDLVRFGIDDEELATRRATPAFRELIRFEIARARALYTDGARGLPHIPNDGSRLTASVMCAVYAGILDAIDAQHADVFAGRARLSTVQKLARLPLAIRLSRAELGDPACDDFF